MLMPFRETRAQGYGLGGRDTGLPVLGGNGQGAPNLTDRPDPERMSGGVGVPGPALRMG